MKKFRVFVFTFFMFTSVFAQTEIPEPDGVTLYPASLTKILIKNFHPSVEIPVKTNSLLFSLHINRRLDFSEGKGAGFGFQYRKYLNKDPNLFFKIKDYIGLDITYDKLLSNYSYDTFSSSSDTRITYAGFLFGIKIHSNNSIDFDFFSSVGLAFFNDEIIDNYNNQPSTYAYKTIIPYGNFGIQMGIKL